MTNEEIETALREGGFPDDLTTDEVSGAIRYVEQNLKFDYPLIVMGTFVTVACQQIYDLFNPTFDETTQQGALRGGLRAYEMVGGGSLSLSPSDPFGIAPLLQADLLYPWSPVNSSFYTPGDWVIWDSDWAAFTARCSTVHFEHVDNRPSSKVRIMPVPTCAERVLVVYTVPRTKEQIRGEDEDWFLKFVEARCAQTLARKYALCAGIQIGGVIRDEGKTAAFWEKEAKRAFETAMAAYERRKHEGLHPAMRSHLP